MLPPFGIGGAHNTTHTGLMLPNFENNALNGAQSSLNHQISSQIAHL